MRLSTIIVFGAGLYRLGYAQSITFYDSADCTNPSGSQTTVGRCTSFNGVLPPSLQGFGDAGELIICTTADCTAAGTGQDCQTFQLPTGCLHLLDSGIGPGSWMLT